ncbi:MAG: VOC family protein [Candidatus Eremiobacteraeota bacterium]|nr:VOC family protein [Candidatus Eremiobacteraeota bacterium]
MPWTLGNVGHFGIKVRDPRKSARWWVKNFGLRKAFEFPGGVAVESEAVTLVLHQGKPNPKALSHVSFHLKSLAERGR